MHLKSSRASLNREAGAILTSHRNLCSIATVLIFSLLTIAPCKAAASTPVAPTYSPASGGFHSIQKVTISDATSGAVIYYTTNGTTPTSKSTRYTTPVTVSASMNFEAVAINSAGAVSPVKKAWYTITLNAATPVISPTPGTYNVIQAMTLKDSTPGASIHYTLDGSYPTTSSAVYSGPIKATTTTSIIAVAMAPNFDASSSARGTYTIVAPPPSSLRNQERTPIAPE